MIPSPFPLLFHHFFPSSLCLHSEAEGWDSRGDQRDWKPGPDWREVKYLSTTISMLVCRQLHSSQPLFWRIHSQRKDQKNLPNTQRQCLMGLLINPTDNLQNITQLMLPVGHEKSSDCLFWHSKQIFTEDMNHKLVSVDCCQNSLTCLLRAAYCITMTYRGFVWTVRKLEDKEVMVEEHPEVWLYFTKKQDNSGSFVWKMSFFSIFII